MTGVTIYIEFMSKYGDMNKRKYETTSEEYDDTKIKILRNIADKLEIYIDDFDYQNSNELHGLLLEEIDNKNSSHRESYKGKLYLKLSTNDDEN